jgi:hypothetical protein
LLVRKKGHRIGDITGKICEIFRAYAYAYWILMVVQVLD